MKRVMMLIILLALLAAATSVSPIQGTVLSETVDNCQEFTATAVITITMTPVKD